MKGKRQGTHKYMLFMASISFTHSNTILAVTLRCTGYPVWVFQEARWLVPPSQYEATEVGRQVVMCNMVLCARLGSSLAP